MRPAGYVRPIATTACATAFGWFFWFGSGVKGNDTGGIIAWQPGIEESALDMAAEHCVHYGKYAVITSVHPWPGDYIGFVCRRAGRFGPLEDSGTLSVRRRVVLPREK